MAKTEVYTCDICKQSKGKDDLVKIEVRTSGLKMKATTFSQSWNLSVDVCTCCLEKKGFVVEYKKEDEEKVAAKNQISLEDKIYDFLSDMGVMFQE